jgi:general secretion pathway protein L
MRGSRAVLAAWSAFKQRRFRALHIGLIALFLVQLIGLNLGAWQARQDLQEVRSRSERLLREAFPSIKVVVDPVLQAEREILVLRAARGEPGPADLETWLDMAAAIWAGQPAPLTAVRWDAQGLTLEAAQWSETAVMQMQDFARQKGWQAQLEGPRLRLSRPAGAAPR